MEKGRLKIFFGYSAGVGKTYAMLKSAVKLKKEGLDVVIGYFEPHDRPDTIKMAEGLEVIALKKVEYKGKLMAEFDVDAAIKRRPQLILVDELAHTNVPGSKNAKRYLDVEELINNGIDVYTTVNVQHIEGLHDLVDSATSVDVSERIPDEIFDYADEVALIDIEPKDLIERMKKGKIYQANHAALALENFFTENKLSSLRELSMRRSADRIERQSHNGELLTKVLVLISPSPSSQKNIRFAARMAEAYHCKYSAMYVETEGELSDEASSVLKGHMNLVRDTGGEMIIKYGEDVVETVASYVKIAGVTDLIIGKTWQSIGKKIGLEDKFITQLPEIATIIIPDNQHFKKRKLSLKSVISGLFSSNELMKKCKLSNKILDVINLLAQSAVTTETNELNIGKIAEILSRAFERSCAVITDNTRFVCPWNGENVDFFDGTNETAVALWCKKNCKPAGNGTETLSNTQAVYFPVERSDKSAAVIAFSCINSKMTVSEKFIFMQLGNICRIIL